MRLLITFILALATSLAVADTFRTEALSEMDHRFMDNQVAELDNIARTQLGRQFNGTKSNDLRLLQDMLDQNLVRADEIGKLQGMGVILGEVLRKEKGLFWTIYEDKLGRTRALEIPGKREFIFPMTMISRRAEVGAEVNVSELYENAASIVDKIEDKRGFY